MSSRGPSSSNPSLLLVPSPLSRVWWKNLSTWCHLGQIFPQWIRQCFINQKCSSWCQAFGKKKTARVKSLAGKLWCTCYYEYTRRLTVNLNLNYWTGRNQDSLLHRVWLDCKYVLRVLELSHHTHSCCCGKLANIKINIHHIPIIAFLGLQHVVYGFMLT
jgi:hypothetical protein